MRTDAVRPYYDNLKKHEKELYLKRSFDIVAASILLVVLAPIMIVISIWIKLDSPGPVFFRQTRITQYGKEFRIFKFRTMVNNA
ncbi:MAG: sugar transferase, partial [Clostridia bacterium]|nr:sugar transferase [Clostridia bacterium]